MNTIRVGCVLLLPLVLVIFFLINSAIMKKARNYWKNEGKSIVLYDDCIKETKAEKEALLKEKSAYLSFLPDSYSDANTVGKMMSYMQNEQAYSMGDKPYRPSAYSENGKRAI